jgi:hypothetical protein
VWKEWYREWKRVEYDMWDMELEKLAPRLLMRVLKEKLKRMTVLQNGCASATWRQ